MKLPLIQSRVLVSYVPLALMALIFLPFHKADANRFGPAWTAADPQILYGSGIDFDVYRRGDKVGFHSVQFVRTEEHFAVTSSFQLQIDILFFTVYRYAYLSESRWRNGRLLHLKADVNDNGTTLSIEATHESSGGMKIMSPDGNLTVDTHLFPTDHWNAEVLGETSVLNTLTGRLNNVRIVPKERTVVSTELGDVAATRYAYTGDLDTEVWYDDAGRWVKMRFKGRDNSIIEYVCRRCQGSAAKQVDQ